MRQRRIHHWTFPPYRGPAGIPAYWRDDVTGQLPAAVAAYFDAVLEQKPMTHDAFHLFRSWLLYWVDAPCWSKDAPDYARCRAEVEAARTPKELSHALHAFLDVGIDPL